METSAERVREFKFKLLIHWQWVASLTVNQGVAGSTPGVATIFC